MTGFVIGYTTVMAIVSLGCAFHSHRSYLRSKNILRQVELNNRVSIDSIGGLVSTYNKSIKTLKEMEK